MSAAASGGGDWRESIAQSFRSEEVRSIAKVLASLEDPTSGQVPASIDGDANEPSQEHAVEERLIFCYGDSLTYGITPGTRDAYPYAKYLEQELNAIFASGSPSAASVPRSNATSVQHFGIPGWTADQMLHHIHDTNTGLCEILHRIPTLSLLIILVGTNDIGTMTNAGKDAARVIVQSIVDLHSGAFDCAKMEGNERLRTLAVGIPGSAYQEKVPVTAEMASYINGAMKGFAAASGGKVSYVDFPFPYRDGDPRWGDDGLHMTPEGYEAFGGALAPRVKSILENDNSA